MIKSQKTNSQKISNQQQNILIIMGLILLLVISTLAAIRFGSVPISTREILRALMKNDNTSTTAVLIKTVRIPRVLGGIVAGASLAVAGVLLQGVMNNSLASPNTIGVNSGAGFAVMLSMALWQAANPALTSVVAFLGALITTLLIFLIAYLADRSRTTIILAGITVSSFLNAGINMMKLMNTDITVNITSFLIGSFSAVTMNKLLIPTVAAMITLVLAVLSARMLNILCMGDDIARSLGLRVNLARFVILVMASILSGVVVSYAGLISFVGLIVPHICRRFFGRDNRFLIPCSGLLGASFVLICDMIGRIVVAPFELPVGIITSLLGGPFFLYLLLKRKGGRRVNA